MAAFGKRGQVSIEFILIVAVSLVYISAVVWPTVESSSQAAVDVKAVADTKLSAMKLANALNQAASSSGDMKKTISIFLPDGGTIECVTGDDFITYKTLVAYIGKWEPDYTRDRINLVNPDSENCEIKPFLDLPPATLAERPDGFECESTIGLLEDLTVNCPSSMMDGFPLFRKLVVEKKSGAVSMEWEE